MRKGFESAADIFSLPGELAGRMKLTLTGDSYLLVESHRGLLEYSDETIVLAGRRQRVRVLGQGLQLAAMDADSMLIRGKILGVELE